SSLCQQEKSWPQQSVSLGRNPGKELTPEKLATDSTNYSKEFRGIRVIRGQAFSEFVAICGGGTNTVGFLNMLSRTITELPLTTCRADSYPDAQVSYTSSTE